MTQDPYYDSNLAAWLGDTDQRAEPEAVTQALDALFAAGLDPAILSQAQDHLKQMLAEEESRSVYYDVLTDTPLGDVYLAVGALGLLALSFGVGEQAFLDGLRRHDKARGDVSILRSAERTARAAQQVVAYLDGREEGFDLVVDLSALSEFHRQVLLATSEVPRGQVTTYGEIARRIGRPQSARAVGQALGHNPVPIVIPCHRVVAADGSLGGYSGGGGLRSKAHLLHLEGVQI